MIICSNCNTPNPSENYLCSNCGEAFDPFKSISPPIFPIKIPTRFKTFVKNDAPKELKNLYLISLIVSCICLVASFCVSFAQDGICLADCIAMALTVLVMYLVKSRACAVILLVYSVLASVFGLFTSGVFASIPMILAGILSTVTFLLLNKAYKRFK